MLLGLVTLLVTFLSERFSGTSFWVGYRLLLAPAMVFELISKHVLGSRFLMRVAETAPEAQGAMQHSSENQSAPVCIELILAMLNGCSSVHAPTPRIACFFPSCSYSFGFLFLDH